MKVAIEAYLKGQRKAGFSSFAEKVVADAAIESKEPEKDEPVKTFVLSPTGGEIHRGESVVDRISKPETLREKIARFDRLSARVRQDRMFALGMLQDSIPDGEDSEDDFDFEDGEIRDDFGDIIETPVQPVETKVEPEPEPVAEPTGDPVEPEPTPASEDA